MVGKLGVAVNPALVLPDSFPDRYTEVKRRMKGGSSLPRQLFHVGDLQGAAVAGRHHWQYLPSCCLVRVGVGVAGDPGCR